MIAISLTGRAERWCQIASQRWNLLMYLVEFFRIIRQYRLVVACVLAKSKCLALPPVDSEMTRGCSTDMMLLHVGHESTAIIPEASLNGL